MLIKKLFFILIAAFLLYCLYLNAYSVLHKEVHFFNDVARDFLLLNELDQKKIVFIGPRSNENGLFHGPLWTYFSYPTYLIGQGNPVVVSWFWILCLTVFLIISYFIAKNIISPFAGILYVFLLSVRATQYNNGLMHALASYFFMPTVFYSIYSYYKTNKVRYLILNLVTLTFMIQLNVGPGGALFLLGCFAALAHIIDRKTWGHLATFLLVPIFLGNYIIFNLRHNFIMVQPVLRLVTSSKTYIPVASWVNNRIESTISLLLIQDGNLNLRNILFLIFMLVLIATVIRIKRNEHRLFYQLMTYFYFGYMLLTFINKGVILGHYVFFLFPLTILWLVSFLERRYLIVFLPISIFIFFTNFNTSIQYTKYIQNDFTAKSQYSWVSLQTVAQHVVKKEQGNEFGYYVFSPDSFAYQPRYAMMYVFKHDHARAFEYTKKPITYVIAAPPPPDNPYMNETWWIKEQVHISNQPLEVETLPSGYKILKYSLSTEEQKIPHDSNIELGLSFR